MPLLSNMLVETPSCWGVKGSYVAVTSDACLELGCPKTLCETDASCCLDKLLKNCERHVPKSYMLLSLAFNCERTLVSSFHLFRRELVVTQGSGIEV